jgi:recombination protein RecR
MRAFAKPLAKLIEELTKMPGIGPKTGQRLAYYILQTSRENASKLAEAILEVKDKIHTCSHEEWLFHLFHGMDYPEIL